MENQQKTTPQIQEIDLLELIQKIWKDRILVFKVCGIAAVVGLIVAFSIPRSYTSKVLIAPESTSSRSNSLGSLASLAGINMGSGSTRDAIYPDLYPDIVKSTPFLVGLFDTPLKLEKENLSLTLAEYITEHQKSPWWTPVLGFPFKVLGWVRDLFKADEEEADDSLQHTIDTFRLSQKESDTAKGIGGCIDISVEKKTWVTTLTVTMQDPLIAATVADSVRSHLQEYVSEYRTSKARRTLEYTEKLYQEAKDAYHLAQEEYAAYSDRNRDLFTLRSKAELERLQNERNLAYSTYNQIAQQLQMAKAKVDEFKPVYTIIQPASVPLSPSKPSKVKTLIVYVFLGGLGSVAWILFFRDMIISLKKK